MNGIKKKRKLTLEIILTTYETKTLQQHYNTTPYYNTTTQHHITRPHQDTTIQHHKTTPHHTTSHHTTPHHTTPHHTTPHHTTPHHTTPHHTTPHHTTPHHTTPPPHNRHALIFSGLVSPSTASLFFPWPINTPLELMESHRTMTRLMVKVFFNFFSNRKTVLSTISCE